jgi:uncharacterized membrane protein
MMTKIQVFVFIVWSVARRPPSRRVAWTMAAVWAFALILPGISVALNPARALDLTIWVGWSNLICICLDGFMLYTAICGLLWSYGLPRQGRRRSLHRREFLP